MKNILLIYNLKSGKKDVGIVNHVCESLESKYQVTSIPIDKFSNILLESFDAVIVCGGDGTIFHVLQGIYKKKLPVGIIPAGTFNYTAQVFGIPLDIDLAVDIILNGHLESVDIAKANDYVFVSSFAVGLWVNYAYIRNKFRNKITKIGASIYALFKMLIEYNKLKLEINNKVIDCLQIHISPRDLEYQLKEVITPKISPLNNNLSISIIKYFKRNYISIFLVYLVTGNIFQSKYFQKIGLSNITISILGKKRKFKVLLDGEIEYFDSNIDITLLPNALKVFRV